MYKGTNFKNIYTQVYETYVYEMGNPNVKTYIEHPKCCSVSCLGQIA